MRILAIDAGTSAVKVAVVADGRVVAASEVGYGLSAPRPGWAEQDAEQWWAATVAATAEVHRHAGAGDGAVDAIAVTGQMQDLVCLDAAGAAARPAILYSDVRAAAEHAELVAELGDDWAAAIGAMPDASHVAAKWRWLQRHEPEAVARTRRAVFGGPGLVVERLVGRACCDPSTAATTGLYDVAAGGWWAPVVDALGLPVPDLVAVDEVAGALTAAAGASLGIAAGTPVVHANGDAAATTVGVCGVATGRPYAYLGTSGWVAVATTDLPRADGVIVLPGLGRHHWMAAAQMSTAGAALDWAREHLLGGATHDRLDELAASTCAAADGVLFLPYLDGARGAPEATGVLVGVRRATSTATIAAAVVEGLAHAVRGLLDAVTPRSEPPGEVSGSPGDVPGSPGDVPGSPGELIVCGGATRSPALRQAIADVTGSVVVPVAADHASILGAATAAHLALGVEPPAIPAAGPHVEPDGRRHAAHARVASTFDALVPTMAPLQASLGGALGAGNPIDP